MSDYLNEIKNDSMNCLITALGVDNWYSLNSLAQTGLLTSEMCIRSLDVLPTPTDFSASVIPLMKVLEGELKNRFYIKYMNFLNLHYPTPTDYIETNGLDRRREDPAVLRKKILYRRRNGEYEYQHIHTNRPIEFTLGNYQYTVGAENYRRNRCDATAIEFYKDEVFGLSADTARVTRWICRLARDLDSLTLLRNNSAHAGNIQSLADANTAMDAIVKIDKLLLSIISPSL